LRFLLDEGLSPRVAAAGGGRRQTRPADDFGTLLARSGDTIPSVILFRGEVTRPRAAHPDQSPKAQGTGLFS